MNAAFPLSRCDEHDQLEPCSVCAADRQQAQSPTKPVASARTTKLFTDRDLAIVIRSALLMIVTGLEKRYGIGPKKN